MAENFWTEDPITVGDFDIFIEVDEHEIEDQIWHEDKNSSHIWINGLHIVVGKVDT